eukprot:scaffold159734_cov35-Prasinocladus_malaysianus.AAC.2
MHAYRHRLLNDGGVYEYGITGHYCANAEYDYGFYHYSLGFYMYDSAEPATFMRRLDRRLLVNMHSAVIHLYSQHEK